MSRVTKTIGLLILPSLLNFAGASLANAAASKPGQKLGPQPQFSRTQTQLLDGPWEFAFDGKTVNAKGKESGEDHGLAQKWFLPGSPQFNEASEGRTIRVPYPYESTLSEIGTPDEIHTIVWYRKTFQTPSGMKPTDSLLLRFSAVDYDTAVWVNGHFVGRHVGGYTPFEFDVAPFLRRNLDGSIKEDNTIVFRAYDDVRDVTQRTGKQKPTQFAIFYKHITGAWKSISLIKTGSDYLRDVQVTWYGEDRQLEFIPTVTVPAQNKNLRFRVKIYEQDPQGQPTTLVTTAEMSLNGRDGAALRVPIPNPKLWFPRDKYHPQWRPNLYHLEYEILDEANNPVDTVSSYTGLRTIRQYDGRFYINGEPLELRGVLNQMYRGVTLFSETEEIIKKEIRDTQAEGFNFARLHQSVSDVFMAWADRMGLLVSAEVPSADTITAETEKQDLQELAEVVKLTRNHPSLVQIDDLNESWGIAVDKNIDPLKTMYQKDPAAAEALRQFGLDYMQKSIQIVRSLIKSGNEEADASGRGIAPDQNGNSFGVIHMDNDGWDSMGKGNATGMHRYDHDGVALYGAYKDLPQHLPPGSQLPAPDARKDVPADQLKHQFTDGYASNGTPNYLSEFGGVSYWPKDKKIPKGTWGYEGLERNKRDFALRLHSLFAAVSKIKVGGFTYTQLKRTGFEVNGLLTEYGLPILPKRMVNAIVTMGFGPNPDAQIEKVRKMIEDYFDQEEALLARSNCGKLLGK